MMCPACKNVPLTMTERKGVEIDYCPTCRGVWLDRGELDKIIERSVDEGGRPPQGGYHRDSEPDSDRQGHRGQYRRKSWLSDLFD